MNEDATGNITALQAEIRRLREELEKAGGEIHLHPVLKYCHLIRHWQKNCHPCY